MLQDAILDSVPVLWPQPHPGSRIHALAVFQPVPLQSSRLGVAHDGHSFSDDVEQLGAHDGDIGIGEIRSVEVTVLCGRLWNVLLPHPVARLVRIDLKDDFLDFMLGTVDRRQLARGLADTERLVHVILFRRRRPLEEELLHPPGRILRGHLPRHPIHDSRLNTRRSGKMLHRQSLVEPGHDLLPHGASDTHPGRVLHRGVLAVAHPDTDDVLGRVAKGPAVFVVIGGTGLGRNRTVFQGQGIVGTKGRQTCLDIR